MVRNHTRSLFFLALSIGVAGCGGGNNAAPAPAPTTTVAAPTGTSAIGSASGSSTITEEKASEITAAKDGYEAGVDYGSEMVEYEQDMEQYEDDLEEWKDGGEKGDRPQEPEKPEKATNPFLEDGETLSDSDVSGACEFVDEDGVNEDELEEATDAVANSVGDTTSDVVGSSDGSGSDAVVKNLSIAPDTDGSSSDDDGSSSDDDGSSSDDDGSSSDDDGSSSDDDGSSSDDDGSSSDDDGSSSDDDGSSSDDDGSSSDDDGSASDEEDDDDDDDALSDEKRLKLAAIWECSFQKGEESGRKIAEDGATGDADDEATDEGGIGTEEDDTGSDDEDGSASDDDDGSASDDDDDDDGTDPDDDTSAACGSGRTLAPIDSLSHQLKDGVLTITVKGTVPGGGYTKPALSADTAGVSADGTLKLRFCITPPPADAATTSAIAQTQSKMEWKEDVDKIKKIEVVGDGATRTATVTP